MAVVTSDAKISDVKSALTAAYKRAVKLWAADGFLRVRGDVERNLTGGVLHAKRNGRLFQSLAFVSRILSDGFVIGTNVIYGIAWEKGFHRRAFSFGPAPGRPFASKEFRKSVLPAEDERARLRFFPGGSGEAVFARRVTIPAKTFKARPWIRPGFKKNMPYLKSSLAKKLEKEIKPQLWASIKHVTVTLDYTK